MHILHLVELDITNCRCCKHFTAHYDNCWRFRI